MSPRVDVSRPIQRSVLVSWDADAAYRRFTAEFGQWWPRFALSVGGDRVRQVVFENRVGGRIYEEHHDGTRFHWGTVTALEPPHRVAFDWHSTRTPADAQQVEVLFQAVPGGTKVELISRGWEKMAKKVQGDYKAYDGAWGAALQVYAKRASLTMALFNVMSALMTASGQRGAMIRNVEGRM